MIVTTTFEERDGKTLLRQVTVFESVEMKEEYLALGMKEGVTATFELLDALVTSIR